MYVKDEYFLARAIYASLHSSYINFKDKMTLFFSGMMTLLVFPIAYSKLCQHLVTEQIFDRRAVMYSPRARILTADR